MPNKVYPEWVQNHKTKGTTVKRVGENYYLYKHTSKRVPGKKNPTPVDTYLGKITPEGIIRSDQKKINVNTGDVIVREFGYSRTVELICPIGWKEPLGDCWPEVLDYIILKDSPESYIQDERQVVEKIDEHIQSWTQRTMLSRRIAREYNIGLDDLRTLSSIYLVTIGKNRMISKISDRQHELLGKLNVELEVP